MQLIPLACPEKAGFSHKVEIDYTDLSKAALTNTLQLFPRGSGTARKGTLVEKVATRVDVEFDGGGTSSLTVQVGDGNDVDRLLTSQEVHTDATVDTYKANASMHAYESADGIDALFTATGANLDALTQGKIEIYLLLRNLDDLAVPGPLES